MLPDRVVIFLVYDSRPGTASSCTPPVGLTPESSYPTLSRTREVKSPTAVDEVPAGNTRPHVKGTSGSIVYPIHRGPAVVHRSAHPDEDAALLTAVATRTVPSEDNRFPSLVCGRARPRRHLAARKVRKTAGKGDEVGRVHPRRRRRGVARQAREVGKRVGRHVGGAHRHVGRHARKPAPGPSPSRESRRRRSLAEGAAVAAVRFR